MAATAFDTLKFARRLKDSGVDDIQAEAQAAAIQEVFAEALETQLAAKGDIQRLEAALKGDIQRLEAALKGDVQRLEAALNEVKTRLEARMTLVQWMLGIVIAAQVLPLLRAIGVF